MLYKVVLNVDSVGQDIPQKVLLPVVLTALKWNLMSGTSLYDLLQGENNTKVIWTQKPWSVACITEVLDLIEVFLTK